MVYPTNFEEKIGFDRIRELIYSNCLSELGRGKVESIHFATDVSFIQTLLNQVAEFREILLMEQNFPISYYFDVSATLDKIEVEGAYPEIHELFDLKRSLETIRAIVNFFKTKEESTYPELNKLIIGLQPFPQISDRLNSILTSHGKIKDNASAELGRIRREILSKQGGISKAMARIIRSAKTEGFVEEDMNPVVREGRIVIPVPASYKRKINGIIHDESATGKTVYIEPAEIVGINNEIRELELAEKREIIKILVAFAFDVRPYVNELRLSYDLLASIDLIRAKAKFALLVDARKPLLVEGSQFRWRKAYHPLLHLALQKENKKVIPLDLELNAEKHILLISGPNAGGKSVCLKTVGLLQYMLQCGLLVTALENSEIGIFQQIFIDIGDEQSIDNDLSTYSSHLLNMKFFTRKANDRSLVLIDEFGTGTEPNLGGAIAEAVLEELRIKKSLAIITTHYSNLKHYALSAAGVQNGAMMFDTEKIEPLFKLEVGRPGSSFAFEIARKIGLSEKILNSAAKMVGEEHINFDKHLREILRDKKYIEEKREKIRKSEKHLQKTLEAYQEELEAVSKERKQILAEAKREAKLVLENANKAIENTIREIKEAQAEKEKTKLLRKEFESLKENINKEELTEDELKIQRKIEKLKQKEKGLASKKTGDSKRKVEKKENIEESDLKKGDKVRMINQNNAGEILEIKGQNVTVAFGHVITSTKRNKLEKISEKIYKDAFRKAQNDAASINWERHEQNLTFKSEIDLRGLRTEDALVKVQAFIDQAYTMNFQRVKILHGKGNGILRQMIRDYLRTFDVVKSFRDEDVRHGGTGITIVELI